jgi:hypothetical protein
MVTIYGPPVAVNLWSGAGYLSRPLHPQELEPADLGKATQISGDDAVIVPERRRGDQQVVGADGDAPGLQVRRQPRVGARFGKVERTIGRSVNKPSTNASALAAFAPYPVHAMKGSDAVTTEMATSSPVPGTQIVERQPSALDVNRYLIDQRPSRPGARLIMCFTIFDGSVGVRQRSTDHEPTRGSAIVQRRATISDLGTASLKHDDQRHACVTRDQPALEVRGFRWL